MSSSPRPTTSEDSRTARSFVALARAKGQGGLRSSRLRALWRPCAMARFEVHPMFLTNVMRKFWSQVFAIHMFNCNSNRSTQDSNDLASRRVPACRMSTAWLQRARVSATRISAAACSRERSSAAFARGTGMQSSLEATGVHSSAAGRRRRACDARRPPQVTHGRRRVAAVGHAQLSCHGWNGVSSQRRRML